MKNRHGHGMFLAQPNLGINKVIGWIGISFKGTYLGYNDTNWWESISLWEWDMSISNSPHFSQGKWGAQLLSTLGWPQRSSPFASFWGAPKGAKIHHFAGPISKGNAPWRSGKAEIWSVHLQQKTGWNSKRSGNPAWFNCFMKKRSRFRHKNNRVEFNKQTLGEESENIPSATKNEGKSRMSLVSHLNHLLTKES